MTSFATSWLTQRTQLRHAHREAERAELKTLYSDFITEASRLLADALTHQTEEITGLVGLYAMVGHMRLVFDQAVISAAMRAVDTIETYPGANRTLHELMDYAHQGGSASCSNSARLAEKTWPPARRQFGGDGRALAS